MRDSPGYGDLGTDIQPDILRLLDAGKIGIACQPESFILIPEKSITAIIGWERK
jgi:cobalamin-dependent methionine synthase I